MTRRPSNDLEIGPAASRPPIDRPRLFPGYRYYEEDTGLVNRLIEVDGTRQWLRGGALAVSPDGATIKHIRIDNSGAVEAVDL